MLQTGALDWGCPLWIGEGTRRSKKGLKRLAPQIWKSAMTRTCRRPEHWIRKGYRCSNLAYLDWIRNPGSLQRVTKCMCIVHTINMLPQWGTCNRMCCSIKPHTVYGFIGIR